MAKKAKNGTGTYKEFHDSVSEMSENDLVLAIDEELNRNDRTPRTDMLTRLIGRFNRLRGERIKLDVLAAARKRGAKQIDNLLDRCR